MPFDPRRHPRWPRGAPDDTSGDGQGGRFAEAGDLAGSIVGNLHGVTTGPWQQRASDQIGARRGEHPRMQYNAQIVDAGQRQLADNQIDQYQDDELRDLIVEFNVAQARGDVTGQDDAADRLRSHLEGVYPAQHGGGLPLIPERREAPRSPQQDQRNRDALASGRQIQERIKAGNSGDPDEGLQIRIDRLASEQGRTGRNVEADRAAADLERYILEDPEGLIAAHAHVSPPARQPEPQQDGEERSAEQVGRLVDSGRQVEMHGRRGWSLITSHETNPRDDEHIFTLAGDPEPIYMGSQDPVAVRLHGPMGRPEPRTVAQNGNEVARTPDQWVRYRQIDNEPAGGVGASVGHPDLDALDARDLRDLAIEYDPNGQVSFTSVELENSPVLRAQVIGQIARARTADIVNWSAPIQGPASLFPAVFQVTPGIRAEISDDIGGGQIRWRRIERAEYDANGVDIWFTDGGHWLVDRDMQLTYRVEPRAAEPTQRQINPRDETNRALVFQREDNDRYNQRVFDRAVEVDQENADVSDSEDEGIRRLREKMQTYRDALSNPDDPESIDAAIDDLVDEFADWDIFFDRQGFSTDRANAAEPDRPNYDTNALPVGYRAPTVSVQDVQSTLPPRPRFADLEPGQTLLDGLNNISGSAFGSQFDSGIPPRWRQAIHDIYDYTDSHTGLRAEVNDQEVSITGGQVNLKGKIYDRDGNPVGNFTRVLNSDGTVRHSLFKIYSSDQQGGGFTSRWFEQVKQQYRDQGFTAVTVSANLDVGGYAWAKIGFDFENRYDARRLLEKAMSTAQVKQAVGELTDATIEEIQELQDRYDAGEWVTPLEISQLGRRMRDFDQFDGYPRELDNGDQIEMWLGKYIMLGSSWGGKLTL